ncbi:MAG: energy transducer TonB [Bacteroidota bacterium]
MKTLIFSLIFFTQFQLTDQPISSPAIYPGGTTALIEHVQSNLEYPLSAREEAIEGIVKVAFIIKTDGTIGSVGIINGLNEACDAAAKAVVESMPKWSPAFQNNIPVRSRLVLSIKFDLG